MKNKNYSLVIFMSFSFQAYRSIPEAEGLKLLADIPVRRGVGVLANTRKIGPELSSKIYKFFMCSDPDVLL